MTRTDLQRVAVHVLARKRHAASGKFGLRAAPAGIATPAFGSPDELEILRTSGSVLIHELGSVARSLELHGAALADVARWVGVELGPEFSVGDDTPELGDVHTPMEIDAGEAAAIGDWFAFGTTLLDRVSRSQEKASTVQIWPEHFDAGCTVTVGQTHINLGASHGDGFSAEPYLYVGPWTPERPGDAAYWNAPFGAVLSRSQASAEHGEAFLRQGLAFFTIG